MNVNTERSNGSYKLDLLFFAPSNLHLSSLPFLRGNKGGNALLFTGVQIGTFIIGLILILADLVLSSPFFILFTCFSLFQEPCFPSLVTMSARAELEVDDVEEEDEEGDKEEARCFFSRSSSFHRTVHFGGLGDGSSSTNQTLGSSLLISSPSPSSASLVLRLILLSFSECCICQKGSNLPSKKSSSAVSMVWLLILLERNSNSAFLAFSRSASPSFSACGFGLIGMKFLS